MSWALIKVPDEMLSKHEEGTYIKSAGAEIGPFDVIASGLQDETYISIDVRFAE